MLFNTMIEFYTICIFSAFVTFDDVIMLKLYSLTVWNSVVFPSWLTLVCTPRFTAKRSSRTLLTRYLLA